MAYWAMFSSGTMAALAGAGYNSFQKKQEAKTVLLRAGEGLLVGAGIDTILGSNVVGIESGSLVYVVLIGGGVWLFFNNDLTRPLIAEVDRRLLTLNVNLGKVEADT